MPRAGRVGWGRAQRAFPPRGALLLVGSMLLVGPLAGVRAGGDDEQERAAATAIDAFFGATAIPTLRVEVGAEGLARLRADPRTYVPGRLAEDGARRYEGVGVKLKGGAGSFRDVDDRPCLTLDLDRFEPGQRFHGLTRLHLNNSVQDETWIHEALAARLFRAAGVPTPQVGHARVWLDGRDLGLYVVKEGVDRPFLVRHFGHARGNLYDGGFCQDVDEALERDAGHGPDDRSDLAALVDACREPELAARERRLGQALDVQAFLTFTALERMTGHWDGYSTNRNNYRLYLRPTDGRAVFLPHGMDQLFGDAEASVLDPPVGLVARAMLEVPAWRARYRGRLKDLLRLFDASASLLPGARRVAAHLLPAVEALGPGALAGWSASLHDLEERLRARAASLREQVTLPEPVALAFDTRGEAFVAGWRAQVDDGEATAEQEAHGGRRAYALGVGAGGAVASWRRRVVLPQGHYRLRANAAVKGVVPRGDPQGRGAGLRLSGGARSEGLTGSASWRRVALDFEVEEGLRQVELVAELRAEKGRAWFEVESFRLVRLP